MNNTIILAGLALLAAVVLAACHYYVYLRLIKASSFSKRTHGFFTVLLLFFACLVPGVFIASRILPRDALSLVSLVAYFWLGTLFYLIIILVFWDLARFFAWVTKKLRPGTSSGQEEAYNAGRRLFMQRMGAGACLLAGSGVTATGIGGAFAPPLTPEIMVRLKKFPADLSGFRIALLSDLHIGPVLGADFLRHVIEKTNALEPDLIAITGDLVDLPVNELSKQIMLLKDLQAPHGVFFTTGNHEFFFGAAQWVKFIKTLGINVLANEMVTIGDKNGGQFELAGVHDFSGGWFDPTMAPDPDKAMAKHDQENELVLLAHQPKQISAAMKHGVGLQLSGHTHGGQIWPFGLLTQLDQPYLSGLHILNEATQIFVTRGVGFWGPPMRIGAPAEIPVIVLSS